jgi:NADH:ubiquinone oxidoreductase subunit 5 (subunit L)/multisubunit Na+/H+ antiporter MnhA subunit
MFILILFLTLPLLSATIYLGLGRLSFEKSCLISVVLTITFLLFSTYLLLSPSDLTPILTFCLLDLDNTKLTLLFMADRLTMLMLLFIGSVSLMVHLYASRYLYSDLNRSRFMMQLSAVTFSIVFLVMSGNLLTAFIGWQLIGFNLYWLLNHCHYDEYANRAAKKKFVINRIGDMSFLLAVILCLYFYSSTDFSVILGSHSPVLHLFDTEITARTLILSSVFIAVMTKSAQFPFHIWLPDTMQTPTPVSAIMHAGVINAGGFLLARLSTGLLLSPILMGIISCIGFITVLLGGLFTMVQPDVKKRLAYSTLSQMGYMVLQCGLGCFSGALFHLIAHGFYKAWSFLNSGNTLFSVNENKPSLTLTKILIGVVVTGILFFLFLIKELHFQTMMANYPLLMIFMLITVFHLNISIWTQDATTSNKLISTFVVMMMVLFYLKIIIFNDFKLLPLLAIQKSTHLNLDLQIIGMIAIALLSALYYVLQSQPKILRRLYYVTANKLYIEEFYRQFLLKPMRQLGDKLYFLFSSHRSLFIKLTAIVLFAVMFAPGVHLVLNKNVAIFCCILLIMLLLAANRARRLKDTIIYLVLSQYALSAIALQFSSLNSEKIALYQMANTALLALLMLYCLYKIKKGSAEKRVLKNNLPWLGAYFTASLFCFIGLPFTSTFISEIIIIREALNILPLLAVGLLIAMLLFTISVLHVLQDYVFKEKAIKDFSIKLSPFEHLVFLVLIAFNVMSGLFPSFAIEMIYSGVHSL